jgi:hypothetical protein
VRLPGDNCARWSFAQRGLGRPMGGPARRCSATPVDTARRLGGPRSSELALHRVKRQASAHAQKYGIVLTLGVLSCPAIARRAASGDRRTRGASAPSNQELSVLFIKNLTKTYLGGTRALRSLRQTDRPQCSRKPRCVGREKVGHTLSPHHRRIRS